MASISNGGGDMMRDAAKLMANIALDMLPKAMKGAGFAPSKGTSDALATLRDDINGNQHSAASQVPQGHCAGKSNAAGAAGGAQGDQGLGGLMQMLMPLLKMMMKMMTQGQDGDDDEGPGEATPGASGFAQQLPQGFNSSRTPASKYGDAGPLGGAGPYGQQSPLAGPGHYQTGGGPVPAPAPQPSPWSAPITTPVTYAKGYTKEGPKAEPKADGVTDTKTDTKTGEKEPTPGVKRHTRSVVEEDIPEKEPEDQPWLKEYKSNGGNQSTRDFGKRS